MKKTTLFMLAPLVFMGLPGCLQGEAVTNPPAEAAAEENAAAAEMSCTEFALEWFQKNAEVSPKENMAVSPLGMYRLLGMLYAGSQNRTHEEIAAAMGWEGTEEAYFQMLREIQLRYQEKPEIQLADSAWVQNKFPIDGNYVGMLRNLGNAEVRNVDFQDKNTLKEINKWASTQTKGRIRQLFEELSPNTELLLCNTLTFSGKWAEEFDKRDTRKGYFTSLDGKEVRFPMMQREGTYRYLKGGDYQWLEMPYEGGEFFMGIFLPESHEKFAEAEKRVTAQFISDCVKHARAVTVDVRIPRFSFRGDSKPTDILKKMGMQEAFTPEADFSYISQGNELMVSQMIQSAYLKVDEKGTEAAAAAAAEMIWKSAPVRKHPTFYADRPFVFVIAERKTGTVLFAGHFVDPETMEKGMAELRDAEAESEKDSKKESASESTEKKNGTSTERVNLHTSGVGGEIQ